jgi:hypothetical protein
MRKNARAYEQARLAVESLTTAWHCVMRIDPAIRADAVEKIEQALESAVRLRDSLRRK